MVRVPFRHRGLVGAPSAAGARFGWGLTALIAIAAGMAAATYSHSPIITAAVTVGVALCYPAWLLGRYLRWRYELRREAARGLGAIEFWLERQAGTHTPLSGGSPKRCPVCGGLCSPRTGRCLHHHAP